MQKEKFKTILDICSKEECVKNDIYKNHDDNMWWPIKVNDYRKRLLIAGLSTRVSYNMIKAYQKVIKHLDEFSYEEIKEMSKEEMFEIIKGLGLSNIRYQYIKSMIEFIENYKEQLLNFSNEKLIELITKEVTGASYKVAQCCVLYMKGYYESGIMPVDSGMKDIELPCLGFPEYKTAVGHNKLREELEILTKNLDLKEIINKNGYQDLNIPNPFNATWWSHLVLIYFKRNFCNKHKPAECPLAREGIHVSFKCQKNKINNLEKE